MSKQYTISSLLYIIYLGQKYEAHPCSKALQGEDLLNRVDLFQSG